jgi:hypothetical protein
MGWIERLVALLLFGSAWHCGGGKDKAGDGELTPDKDCVAYVRGQGIEVTELADVKGVRTPLRVDGRVGSITLSPRGKRDAVMDCSLVRGLFEADVIFRAVGIDRLEFSAGYDYRNRRGTATLSAHAHGLAIDVHALSGRAGKLDVARDFEKGVGEWKKLRPGAGKLGACIGDPRTEAGRTLRELVCRLKLHTGFRIIVTPDDNADHRDHLHLEVYADEMLEAPAGG